MADVLISPVAAKMDLMLASDLDGVHSVWPPPATSAPWHDRTNEFSIIGVEANVGYKSPKLPAM